MKLGNEMKDSITVLEAYKAMYLYLQSLQKMTQSDDLAGFLGSMMLLPDGKPVDSAVWEDWLEAIAHARSQPNVDFRLTK